MKASVVSLEACSSYRPDEVESAIAAVLTPLGGMSAFLRPGERILLKPNFIAKSSEGCPACTHAEVILAVARLVREQGATPVISDSPSVGTAVKLANHIGLLPRAREEGFEVRNLRGSVKRSVTLGNKTFNLTVAREAVECNGIINLPKLKAHSQTTLTLGIKNLYGCVVGKRKVCRHFQSKDDLEWFSEMLVANAKILAPRLTLMDGVEAMEGWGPIEGKQRHLGVFLASPDVTALDTVCCHLVGYPPLRLCTLKAASRLEFGKTEFSDIICMGDSVETFRVEDFDLPRQMPIYFNGPRVVRSCLRSLLDSLVWE